MAALAHADPQEAAGRYMAKPLKGDYYVYGGSLGDSVPPTDKDRKVSMMITGPLAKELFDQIGPDRKDACGAGPDHRTRLRGHLTCVWQKSDGHACYFGLDVPTGKSTHGTIC
jgi:hypothetical protein